MDFRIGQGFDVHAFAGDGDHVMLGGVRVPHTTGLAAHSDGDVILHALCDALLGAAALGDIGRHFPPGEERWRNAASRDLLVRVMHLIDARGWVVVNTDVTVVCEQPRVSPHIEAMRMVMAEVLRIDSSRVSVKASTTEGLGFCGRGEGIAAIATVLVSRTETGP